MPEERGAVVVPGIVRLMIERDCFIESQSCSTTYRSLLSPTSPLSREHKMDGGEDVMIWQHHNYLYTPPA